MAAIISAYASKTLHDLLSTNLTMATRNVFPFLVSGEVTLLWLITCGRTYIFYVI